MSAVPLRTTSVLMAENRQKVRRIPAPSNLLTRRVKLLWGPPECPRYVSQATTKSCVPQPARGGSRKEAHRIVMTDLDQSYSEQIADHN